MNADTALAAAAAARESAVPDPDDRHRHPRRPGGGAVHGGDRPDEPSAVRPGAVARCGCSSFRRSSASSPGVLLAKVFPDVRGSGVPQTEAAYHLAGGVIPARVPLGKFLTGVLCIGSGHSMGREGPSVQIGAGLASVIGRWLRLSPARVRDLVPVGAAGALAAAFNTPVAAVLFALEEIIGDMNAALLGSTVVASVAAVIVERSILGNEPLFHVPTYHLVHPAELLAYAALGVVGGVVSLVFCKGLLALRAPLPAAAAAHEDRCSRRSAASSSARILLYSPAIMGVGYEYVDQALNGGLLLRTMVILCFLKLGRDDRLVRVRQRRRHLRAEPVHRRHGRRCGRHGRAPHRAVSDRRPGRVRARRHGDAVRRHHPRADDVGVHDFRDHAGLSDPRAADGGQSPELRDLAALSAGAGVPRAAAAGRRPPALAWRHRPRGRPAPPGT